MKWRQEDSEFTASLGYKRHCRKKTKARFLFRSSGLEWEKWSPVANSVYFWPPWAGLWPLTLPMRSSSDYSEWAWTQLAQPEPWL